MSDNIRPRKSVGLDCKKCGWTIFVDALDPRLPGPEDACNSCRGVPLPTEKAVK